MSFALSRLRRTGRFSILLVIILGYLFRRWVRPGKRASAAQEETIRRRLLFNNARSSKEVRSRAQSELSEEGFDSGEFATLPSGTTHYSLSKKVEQPSGLVVLVHGFGVFSFVYQAFSDDLLTSRRQVLSYDLYGHGLSVPESDLYDLDLFIAQLSELLDFLGISKPFCLFGHSMGGMVAAEFSRRYPTRIQRLVLLCPAGSSPIGIMSAIRIRSFSLFIIHLAYSICTTPVIGALGMRLAAVLCRISGQSLGKQGLAAMSGKLTRISSDSVLRPLGNRFLNMNTMTVVGYTYQTKVNPHHHHAFQSILKNVNLLGDNLDIFAACHDTLSMSTAALGSQRQSGNRIAIFWGTDDEYVPFLHLERLKSVMPYADVITFQDCDHFLFLNRPDEFSAAALRFIDGYIHKSPSAPLVRLHPGSN